MATVVLTEKPSVARDIARVLGASKRGQGYVEGNGYIVTWALGHLVQFAEPDDYGPPWKGRWSFAQLPMIPEQWKLKTTRSTSDQYQIVKKLLNSPQTERVICATDAGREGEHIFRLIYQHTRCKKPFSRLWISSLTDEAIRGGFRALQEGTAFDHLAAAARARGQADWLMGMNLTRAYTVHNKALCTIGRVQTPTLSMGSQARCGNCQLCQGVLLRVGGAVRRGLCRQVLQGRPDPHRQQGGSRAPYIANSAPTRSAPSAKSRKKSKETGRLPSTTSTTSSATPTATLASLRRKPLNAPQALYETHKLITYPRTESRHISEDMVPKLPVYWKS